MHKPERLAGAEAIFQKHMTSALDECGGDFMRAAEKVLEQAMDTPDLAGAMCFLFLAYACEAAMRDASKPN